jgi:hypothetical protein
MCVLKCPYIITNTEIIISSIPSPAEISGPLETTSVLASKNEILERVIIKIRIIFLGFILPLLHL